MRNPFGANTVFGAGRKPSPLSKNRPNSEEPGRCGIFTISYPCRAKVGRAICEALFNGSCLEYLAEIARVASARADTIPNKGIFAQGNQMVTQRPINGQSAGFGIEGPGANFIFYHFRGGLRISKIFQSPVSMKYIRPYGVTDTFIIS